ncbi:hypothetical protein BT96DRAFT_989262 [Gymnopus androsaceus JB14]|uniref:F-box domain-containing protein n=1 Tax=Gymnopus androsaceus JB14 TaxID=1447944 RepID=A0A6A4I6J4_9AGAR|nr:hypothetical protein BT96DRAFT_989262 [Gymnopus androsaceus JB14]
MEQYLSQSRIEDPIWLEPNEISFLRMRISEEEALKDAKLVEIASLRNILAPVRRIPLEILTEIFELVLGNRHLEKRPPMLPLDFGRHYAFHWKKVVLGQELILWVEDWIIRSQMVPLDLYLDFYFEGYDEPRDVFTARGKQFLEYILTQFGHKVRSLNVTGHPSSFLPILHLSPSFSLLSLEEISLTIFDNEDDTIEALVNLCPRKIGVFLGAPKLRQVELNNASLLELLAPPTAQLNSLKFSTDNGFEDPAMFVGILLQCKQLVNLEIDLPSKFSTQLFVLLPRLRSLKIYCSRDSAGSILRCVTTPVLEQLSLCYQTNQNWNSLLADVTAFQQRSSTALSSLDLHISSWCSHEVEIITEKVVGIFSLFPAIQSLEIDSSGMDLLLRAMTCNSIQGQHILPNLKDLVLFGNYSRDQGYPSVSGLKSMILSRWWPEGSDDGLASTRRGLSRLQKVTLRGFQIWDSAEGIAYISTLPGLVLDYWPVRSIVPYMDI